LKTANRSGFSRKLMLRLASLVCILIAVFHLAAMLAPEVFVHAPGDSGLRHGSFLLINGCLSLLFWRDPAWLKWPLLLLTLQQLWSHGADLVHALQESPPRWDLRSLLMLALLPLLWAFVVVRREHRRVAP
jgi:hypothetical protein